MFCTFNIKWLLQILLFLHKEIAAVVEYSKNVNIYLQNNQ